MSVASRVREKIDRLFHEKPPEPIIEYGPYDAIWPTIGVAGFAWMCNWCGASDGGYSSTVSAGAGAADHGRTHTDVGICLIEAELDPEEAR